MKHLANEQMEKGEKKKTKRLVHWKPSLGIALAVRVLFYREHFWLLLLFDLDQC